MIKVEVQEAGTGKWFSIVEYHPGSEAQMNRARRVLEALDAIDIHARAYDAEGMAELNARLEAKHAEVVRHPISSKETAWQRQV